MLCWWNFGHKQTNIEEENRTQTKTISFKYFIETLHTTFLTLKYFILFMYILRNYFYGVGPLGWVLWGGGKNEYSAWRRGYVGV